MRTYLINGRRYSKAGLMVGLKTGALDPARVAPMLTGERDRDVRALFATLGHPIPERIGA